MLRRCCRTIKYNAIQVTYIIKVRVALAKVIYDISNLLVYMSQHKGEYLLMSTVCMFSCTIINAGPILLLHW